MSYTDIVYEERDQIATIAINRPTVMNAFRGQTVEEMLQAMLKAGWDKNIAAIVLTGTGDRAFCTGGDQSAHAGQYDGRGTAGLPIEELHSVIRDVPKPVIARVQGYAIGGGNVLATLCDMTIASDKAVFGRSARRSLGRSRLGTAYLAAVVGEEGARDLVYVPPLWRAGSAGDGAVQRGRAARPARRRGRQVGPRAGRRARPRSRSPSAPSMRRPSTSAASAAWACRRSACTTRPTIEGRRACVPREAQARLPQARRVEG